MKQILVIRRDNIGDLVCTTPLFTALRKRFPDAWIGAFVNSYNAPVLDRNPDLNEVISYTKLKHLGAQRGALGALKKRLTMLWRLRRMKLDCVVLATSDFVPRLARLARLLAPQEVVGFSDGSRRARVLDRAVEIGSVAYMHEVERVFALTELFGIEGEIPPPTVIPAPPRVICRVSMFSSRTRREVCSELKPKSCARSRSVARGRAERARSCDSTPVATRL